MAKSNKNTLILWSEDEVKLLKKLFPKGKTRQIADQTGRTLAAVRRKAFKMGFKTRDWRLWSADEIKLLYKLYQNQTIQSIADILGRSLNTVYKKASNLGLRKDIFYPIWSIQEESLLKKLYPTNTVTDIAKRIGRSVSAVRCRASLLGLSNGRVGRKKVSVQADLAKLPAVFINDVKNK